MRLDWKKTALVIGQDWMVFAPVNPSSLACAAIPLFAGAGNPWARLPQVRLERRFGAGLVQAAVLAPQSGDFNSAFLAQPNSGSLSEVPYLQGRLAWTSTNAFGSGKPGAIGVSGHYGQSQVTTTGGTAKDLDSTGGAVDWSWPLGKHVLLSGEGFLGENLAGFQAGVFQGYNPDAGDGFRPWRDPRVDLRQRRVGPARRDAGRVEADGCWPPTASTIPTTRTW